MRGAFANKFGLYYGKEGYDIEKKYRITPKFGDDPDSAMNEIKKQIIDLLTAAENDNKQDIRNNKLSHIFKSKILGTYFPNKYLNIYSEEHLNFFLNKIGLSVVPKADIFSAVPLFHGSEVPAFRISGLYPDIFLPLLSLSQAPEEVS